MQFAIVNIYFILIVIVFLIILLASSNIKRDKKLTSLEEQIQSLKGIIKKI